MTDNELILKAREAFKASNNWHSRIKAACDRGEYDNTGYLRPFIDSILKQREEAVEE